MTHTITFNGEQHEIAVSIPVSQLALAPLCANCAAYVEDPRSRIVERQRGWVHVGTNKARCPGQEDDDTDDRAEPVYVPRTGTWATSIDDI